MKEYNSNIIMVRKCYNSLFISGLDHFLPEIQAHRHPRWRPSCRSRPYLVSAFIHANIRIPVTQIVNEAYNV